MCLIPLLLVYTAWVEALDTKRTVITTNGHLSMDEDPISQFFPAEEHVDLYSVLDLTTDASPDDIKKSYRRLALRYHPDKQTPSTDKAAEATLKFQKISFAYTVISDAKRRKRYDETGRTDEGFEDMVGEEGWHAYFGAIFESVTRQKLDEMKAEYQGTF